MLYQWVTRDVARQRGERENRKVFFFVFKYTVGGAGRYMDVSLLFTGRPSNAAASVALAPHPQKAARRIREKSKN